MGSMQGAQEIEDHLSGPEIQIPGWLVGQQNRRVSDQGARQYDSLLLASGQFPRTMPSACSKSYLLQPRRCCRSRPGVSLPSDQKRHHHVLQCRKFRQEIVNLPNKPNFPVPEIR